MKILIAGGQGLLGKALSQECIQQGLPVIPLSKSTFDITKPQLLEASLSQHNPTHLINAAAYTKVDQAERNPSEAFAVNALGARNIARLCQKHHITLLHVSTDYVFDGQKRLPYTETDTPRPISVYGQSKAEGERWVQSENPTAQIVRLQALYGGVGVSFVQTMLHLSTQRDELEVVADQHMSPSYVPHIAEALLRLIRTEHEGIFHLHNEGSCSWYTFAREIFALVNRQTTVNPISSNQSNRPAARPMNAILSMQRWRNCNLSPLPHWKQALKEYLLHIREIAP